MKKPEFTLIKDCPMRHANGNCLPVGGFCTAVKAAICDAARSGYASGYSDGQRIAKEKESSQ